MIETDLLSVFGSVALHPLLLLVIKVFSLLLLLLQYFGSQGFLNKSAFFLFVSRTRDPLKR